VGACGGKVPAEPVIDGRDLSGVLFGKEKQSTREAHYYFSGYALQAVRKGPWKLAVAPQNDTAAKTTEEASVEKPRLYHLTDDIGETTNVADKNPKVVEELKGLFTKMNDEIGGAKPTARRPAGVVANPKTLYPTDDAPATKAAELDKLKVGDTVASASAPQVNDKPFTVACKIETGQPDTVIVAQGGSTAGYALHLKDGCVVFSVRTGTGDAVTEIQSAAIKGAVEIVAKLEKGGAMTLTVGDQKAVTGKAAGLIPRQPAEDFCVGFDSGAPVGKYGKVKAFEGKLSGLKVTTP
jgi:arylsulfatase A